MPARSLRVRLLRLVLPPITALLALGAVVAYYPTLEPAVQAYDQALASIGVALGAHIRERDGEYSLELVPEFEKVLRGEDRVDTVYYRVLSPQGRLLGGEPALPGPPPLQLGTRGPVFGDGEYHGQRLRLVSMQVACGAAVCGVQVGETTLRRSRLTREILLSSLFPELLIAIATLLILWYGVKRGLGPLARLSEEIRRRAPGDLRAIDAGRAPAEAQPLVEAINGLLGEVAEAQGNQQRFLANAAHQLRTPLAGIQAHTELALAQPVPETCRAELEQVHFATIRTARLANQLLALARAEPGGRPAERLAPIDLKAMVEEAADEWVRDALARDIDLGFELRPAPVRVDALLMREALANLVHNAIEYTPHGGHVTVRTGAAEPGSVLEVADTGPGIPAAERERVLERFYRVPGTAGTGSGLGLAIVREIAAAHGARIEILDGAQGRGCRVRLNFPPAAPI
jgi:two-component system sensor histidine kinase TctE